MQKLIREIIGDLKLSTLFPALCIGFILGLLIIIVEISFAAMIFSGEISHLAMRGAGLTLTGAFIVCLVTALTSSFKSVISLPQDAPVAIFSGGAAMLAAGMGASSSNVFITIVAALMFTTILTALLLYIIARFSLVHFFRYIPYPVIGGFLAGSGWLLSMGSLEVMTNGSVSLSGPQSLFANSTLVLWLPGAFLALSLFLILRRFSHFSILPVTLVSGVLIFHLVLYLSGISLEDARDKGLLFESLSSGGLWPVFSLSELSSVEWKAVFSQLPVFLTIPLITLIGLLLNVGGIELASRKDINMDREILANSFSNVLAGSIGSPPAYSTLSLSMLGFKTGAYTRLVGIVAAMVVAMSIIWGDLLISIFPKAVLGGFLMLLGLFFIWDWVVETRKKMILPDYIIILIILIAIAWIGFFQGVIIGILLSVILFVVRFSQVPVLRQLKTGSTTNSKKSRPLPHKKIIVEQGQRIKIFELTGYLFFGSVNTLIQRIQDEADLVPSASENYVFVDFSQTTGVDVSVVSAFVRLLNKISSTNTKIVFISPHPLFLFQLRQHNDSSIDDELFLSFNSLDRGLEWAEDRIIEEQVSLFESQNYSHGQSRLFDQVADEMLQKLQELEYLESIMSSINEYYQELNLNKDEILIRPGENINGFFWIQQGKIAEYPGNDLDSGVINEFGPGDYINVRGIFQEIKIQNLYKSE
ncbi:MAG: SulP family inorganic anion transporter, partial [Desulfonatronovibrio sp.]